MTLAQAVEALEEARERTLALVASISDENLVEVQSPLMSPLVWDLGHIAAFEDLWLVHRLAGEPMLRPELAELYDAFETPRAERGDLDFLGPSEARSYLDAVRERSLELFDRHSEIHELVLRHEQQHNETMLQTIQLARLDGYEPVAAGSADSEGERGALPTGLELIEIPAGECTIGAPSEGFAYDNERPRHDTDVRGYLIGRTPITNASYLRFVEGGGYERREWWSEEGWAWKEEYDITRPEMWTADLRAEWRLCGLEPLHPRRPVVHISWFEADAFARAHGARLPTEIEWEKAATWDQQTGLARRFPWGDDPPVPGVHGNLDQLDHGPAIADAHPDGASPYGCLGMVGDVWEWTASDFGGYPGFRAHPYREYSEVFFGGEYKVLRGGSWATRARVATPTFRNWDFPQRRQIFAGLRIARISSAPTTAITIDSFLDEAAERVLADDVLDGLTRPFKELPPKHFYDARGSELFERICELPEYYQTRTELQILSDRADEIVADTRAGELVELGAGAATKARVLLDAMERAGTLSRYVPLDVSQSALEDSARALVDQYDGLAVHGVIGDIERHLDGVPDRDGHARLVALLGGTIGNFPPGTRRRLLRRIGGLLGDEDRLLLGTDLVKDPAVIEAAYDDAEGVTAEFNRNVLHVMNRELGANFRIEQFEHVAFFDREREWIEMRLRAQEACTIEIDDVGLTVEFAAGEELRTEISAKFTRPRVEADLAAAGLELEQWYTDGDDLFALSLARRQ